MLTTIHTDTHALHNRERHTLQQNKEIIIDTPHTMAHNPHFQLQTLSTQQNSVRKWRHKATN